jgi:hypothetical protein
MTHLCAVLQEGGRGSGPTGVGMGSLGCYSRWPGRRAALNANAGSENKTGGFLIATVAATAFHVRIQTTVFEWLSVAETLVSATR